MTQQAYLRTSASNPNRVPRHRSRFSNQLLIAIIANALIMVWTAHGIKVNIKLQREHAAASHS
jgi:hypothetical protein